jgi:tetratricopeptide (TPR) repeat protein
MAGCWRTRIFASILLIAVAGCSRKRTEADFLESGKKLFEKKDYPRALLEFRNASNLKPADPEPFYQVGVTYLKLGQYGEAATSLRKATELNPKHAGAQLQLAELLAALGDKELVGRGYDRAQAVLADAPGDPSALNALALTELRLRHAEEAQKHLEEAFRKFPQNLRVAANLASIKLARRDFKGAEDVLLQVVAQAPKSTQPLLVLGGLYVQMRNYPEAEKQYRRVLDLDPNHQVALLDLATVQDLKHEPLQAEQTYKRLSALPGRNKHVYAVYLFEEGKREMAIAEFERLARLDRQDRAARTRLLVAYLNTGRLADAEKVLAAALKKNSKDSVALLQRAEISLAKGRLEQAQSDIETVIHFQPDLAEGHYVLAAVQHARGAEATRRQELASALRLRPSMLPARLQLAQSFITGNDPKSALEVLDQAPPDQQQTTGAIVQRNWGLAAVKDWTALRKGIDQGLAADRNTDLLLQDAILRTQQKDYERARASLQEGLKGSPDDVRLLKALAGTYVAEKRASEALIVIRDYASQRPKSAPVQYFLGKWLMATGSSEQAKAAFRQAKEDDPGFVEADLAIAELDSSAGNDAAARQELTDVLAARGEDARVRLMLGAIEESAGNLSAAAGHYRKALQTDPKNFMALNNLAFLLTGMGDFDEALQLSQNAMDAAPAEPAIEDTLGWALYCKGMYQAAIPHLETANSKQSSPRTQYHLAMAYFRVGRDQQARETYMAALKADPKLPEAKMAASVIALSRRF